MDSFISSFHGEVDVSEWFSHLSHHDAPKIWKHASELLGKSHIFVSKEFLHSIKKPIESMFSFHDLEFCDIHSVSFVAIVCSYTKEGTCLDVMKLLNKGIDIGCVPKLYMHEGKLSIGMVCKLFGLRRCGNIEKMDCPRVWDLETDEIVDNPNFGNDPIHQIAAITHRWGPNEITYKHLVKLEQVNTILKELGKEPKSTQISPMSAKLSKIRDELRNQIRYVWMDTLCIDKTSSVELDMSIRSMYRWYSNASFVYLEYYTNFDEWCTRGWTLQEGHAAESLHVSPGHGNSFMELISRWDDNSLYKLALDRVPERFLSCYWICLMNERKTTVTEDKAYALVGVLGISFQFAYGEGEISSSRLAEEITKQKGDATWFVSNFIDSKNICDMQETYLSHYSNIIPVTNHGITLQLDHSDTRRNIIGHCMFIEMSDEKILSMGLEYKEVTIQGFYGNLHIYPPYAFDGSSKYKIQRL
jgi:hypothetical protein